MREYDSYADAHCYSYDILHTTTNLVAGQNKSPQ
jgi:hypothetical protein